MKKLHWIGWTKFKSYILTIFKFQRILTSNWSFEKKHSHFYLLTYILEIIYSNIHATIWKIKKKLTGVTLIGFFHAFMRLPTKVYSILKGSSNLKFWYFGLFMHWTAFMLPKNTSFNHWIDTDGTFHSLAFLYLSPSQLKWKINRFFFNPFQETLGIIRSLKLTSNSELIKVFEAYLQTELFRLIYIKARTS